MFSNGYVHVLISFLYIGNEDDYGTDSESDSDLSSEYEKKAPMLYPKQKVVYF